MRITWLLEHADRLSGGVKVAIEDANWLAARGHDVTVVSKSGPPAWMELRCAFRRVDDFHPSRLPPADVRIGVSWETIPALAAGADECAAVHLCHCFEGEMVEHQSDQQAVDAAYRTPGVQFVTISQHLATLLSERFGIEAQLVTHAIDHQVHYPGPMREAMSPVRIGLVGSYQVVGKDIATGIEACRQAHAAGLDLQLVRVTNTGADPRERDLPFPVEFHERVAPARMGDLYRSLDVFLGTCDGPSEGFSLPAAEALACGVPCVLTEAPCQQNHSDNQFALFVPPRDAVSMAEALVVAGRAPEVRMALRKSGIAAAAHYTQGNHGRQFEQALLTVLARRRNSVLNQLRAVPPARLQRDGATDADRATGETRAHRDPAPTIRADAAAPLRHEPEGEDTGAPATRTPYRTPVIGFTTAGDARDAEEEPLQQLTDRLAHSLRQAAERLRESQDFMHASRFYSAAHCLWPEVPVLASEAAWCRHLAGDTLGSLQSLKSLVDAGVDDVAVHERRGLLLHACGRAGEAAQAFRAAIAAGGRTADAYNNLGVVLYQSGDNAGARSNFLRALTLDPDHQDARANLEDVPA